MMTAPAWVCLLLLTVTYDRSILSFRIPAILRHARGLQQNGLSFMQMASSDNLLTNRNNDPSAFIVGVLGDLHLDPRHMEDHLTGRAHFESILKDEKGHPRPSACLVSLGDLGESKSISPETSTELFSGTTACFHLAKGYLDGFGVPHEVVGGNHDLEGLDEFPTDQANLDAYLQVLGKSTPHFKRLIAEKTLLVGLGSTVFRGAQFTSHEVFIDDKQVSTSYSQASNRVLSTSACILYESSSEIIGLRLSYCDVVPGR
jgi:Calcineurin-like phosphoesterase